jgi:hypothetical protein
MAALCGLIGSSGFRGEDLYVIVCQNMSGKMGAVTKKKKKLKWQKKLYVNL